MQGKLTVLLTVVVATLAVGAGSTIAYLSQHHGTRPVAATNSEETGDQETSGDSDNQTALAVQAKVTADQAKAAALAGYPAGATATTPQLEKGKGTVVYSVEVYSGGKKYDVNVDAKTGKVLQTDSGDNNNDNTDRGD